LTPGEAIVAGADYIVVGRPILKPPVEIGSHVDAAKRILAELDA
jgi:orotidine-5'-phosphate decarboxylase